MQQDEGIPPISSILRGPPAEVSQFISDLANGEPRALRSFEARSNDAPFDMLATYWSVSGDVTRLAIARGLELFFAGYEERQQSELPIESRRAVEEALGFCGTIIGELDVDVATRF